MSDQDEAADAPLQPMPDVSDLKTFDVPDPIETRGSFLRACALAFLGGVLALGFLRLERSSHYFWAFEHDESRRSRERAQELIAELPPAEVLERVLQIKDPARKGAFHKALAETGDEAHIPAIIAYMEAEKGYSWNLGSRMDEAIDSLNKWPEEKYAVPLFAVLTNGKANDEVKTIVRGQLEILQPELLQEPVLAIKNPVKRGRWHKVLATTGDPKQIPAIFAAVEASDALADHRFEAEAKSLVAFGEAGTEQIKEALHSKNVRVINLAAEALRDVNLPFLIKYCREQLDEYESGIFGEGGLRQAFLINQAWKSQNELGANVPVEDQVSAAANTMAEATMEKFNRHAFRNMEMLKALKPVPNNEGVDFCFAHGLSSFSTPVAEFCAKTLQSRLTPDRLIDVMFSFIAKKDQFSVDEVDVYENMLRHTGTAGGVRIVHNLNRLLDEKKGDPSEVFWITKKMAFQVLAETGQASALPTLTLYLKDINSFYETETNRLGQTSRTEITFKSHCQKAIDAIKNSGR